MLGPGRIEMTKRRTFLKGVAAVGVLYNELPAVNGDYKATVFTRDCEVDGAVLNGGSGVDAAGKADLLALGVVVR